MSKRRIVDPPSGWRYGFPAECDDETWNDPDKFTAFLRASGYPEDELEFASSYIRVWFEDDEDD